MLNRLRMIMVLLLVSSLFAALYPGTVPAQAQTVSTVYIDPVSTSSASGSIVTVQVRTNLASGERINGFDVRLNYENWGAVLDALSIDSSNNVFASGSPSTLARCADGVALDPDGFCPTDDSPSGGQIHLAQGLVGTPVSGPLIGVLLFSAKFAVNGTGSSLLVFDRTNLLNPGPDQFPNPHFVQVVPKAGVFGNTGLVAFFDFEPSVPPAILSGQNVLFDAGASFKPGAPGVQIASYSWDFGDGAPAETTTGPTVTHSFSLPGEYRVRLTITDTDSVVGQVERTVKVMPVLGGLMVTVRDQEGRPQRFDVRVVLFNSTFSSVPVYSKTIDGAGVVSFDGLSPGTYFLRFSGPTLEEEASRQMGVVAGWTSMETVYLKVRGVSSPGEGLGAVIFIGSILGGLGVVGTALVWQRRSQKNARSGRLGSGKTVGSKGRKPGRR